VRTSIASEAIKLRRIKMGRSSEKHHQEIFLRMVQKKSTHYSLLKIWDGQYAAFWNQGFKVDHCIAVAEHDVSSFAFLSTNIDEVREFINGEEKDLVKKYTFLHPPILV
jgi:hypothetical protein